MILLRPLLLLLHLKNLNKIKSCILNMWRQEACWHLKTENATTAGNRCLRKFKAQLSPRVSGSIEKQDLETFASLNERVLLQKNTFTFCRPAKSSTVSYFYQRIIYLINFCCRMQRRSIHQQLGLHVSVVWFSNSEARICFDTYCKLILGLLWSIIKA